MSVIVETDSGWLLDNRANILCQVSSDFTGELSMKYQMRKSLFDIVSPFVMDSQFEKTSHVKLKGGDSCITKKKRKRKRKEPLNIGELLAEEFHEQNKSHICKAHACLLKAGTQCGYFLSQDSYQSVDNNVASRLAAAVQGAGDLFGGLFVGTSPEYTEIPLPLHEVLPGMAVRSSDLVNGVWQHKGKNSALAHIDSQPFIIPPECTFIWGEMAHLTMGASVLGTFDLLVLDPPWESKSVKRLKKYNTLGNTELLALPLESLMSPGCLVVVWVTNRQKHRDFVTNQLFPRKCITHLATWFWLKVTKAGQPVRDIEDKQKRPYEVLLLGRYTAREPIRNAIVQDPAALCIGNRDQNLDAVVCKQVLKRKANVLSGTGNDMEEKPAKKHCINAGCPFHSNISSTDFQQNEKDVTPVNKNCTNASISLQIAYNTSVSDSGVEDQRSDSVRLTDTLFGVDVEPEEERPVAVNDGHISVREGPKETDLHVTIGIPDNRVIVSVPCSLHSKKPPLYDVLKRYIPEDARCCEMFARNLQPGWASWGNEVLLHQHLDYYEPVT